MGARDPRLLPDSELDQASRLVSTPASGANSTVAARPLFRHAWQLADAAAVPVDMFQGSSATAEVAGAIASSAQEPPGFFAAYLRASGLSAMSGLAVELSIHFFSLWLLGTLDRLDLRRSATAEHICRRILQCQVAISRNPRAPAFEGLEVYLRHAHDMSGSIAAPRFSSYVASVQKDESQVMKQSRLAREETEAAATSYSLQADGEVEDAPTGRRARAKAKAAAAAKK